MKTWLELFDYCRNNADRIYVRAHVNGKVGTYSLSEVSFSDAIEFIDRWFTDRILPPVLLPPG